MKTMNIYDRTFQAEPCRRSATGALLRLGVILAAGAMGALPAPAPADVVEGESCHHVLFLNSYHAGFQWSDNILKGIRNVFAKHPHDIDLHVEYMDTKRLWDDKYAAELFELYQHKCRECRPEVILASDDNALDFLLKYRDDLFPGVPIVFCGINNYTPQRLKGRAGYTGVVEAEDIHDTLEIALKLMPKARGIFVITDKTTTTGRIYRQRVPEAISRLKNPPPYTICDDIDMEELLKTVESLPADTIILRLSLSRDRYGQRINQHQATAKLCERSCCPMYTCWAMDMGTGIVGGKLVNGVKQGETAARMAERILNGEKADDIPVVTESPNQYMFDYRALRRFGISASDLPGESVILYKPLGFYEKHKSVIQLAAMVFVCLLLIIAILLANLARRRRMEQALRRSEQTERNLREKLTALHEVNATLTSAESLDTLCRLAVQLAMERLGFEKVGIWFTTDQLNIVRGSYGIDRDGNLRDERAQRKSIEDDLIILRALCEHGPRTFYRPDETKNRQGETPRRNARAVATLWDGKDVIGYISASPLRDGKEITESQQKILALLASTLGHLCTRLAIEQDRTRLAEAVEQASEAVVITDRDTTIQYTNRSLGKILGYGPEETISQSVEIFYAPLNDPDILADMRTAMNEGRSWSRKKMIGRHKNGEYLDLEVLLSPIRNPLGTIVSFVHIIRDVSKEANLEAQLRQAAKMEAIGRLAGGVAHDFNNQLTVVKGYCDLLLRDLDEENPVRESIEEIQQATQHASTLTSELLSFSRKQILKPQVVDPNKVLRNMERRIGVLGEDIELTLRLADDVGNVRVDPNRFEQAITNLAINARDAMPRGGQLIIETTNVTPDKIPSALSRNARAERHVMLSVVDTGVGMDRQTIEHIFEPFFSTKDKTKGTGLGLAMVYGFVQQSDGHIDVASDPGKGATFHIYLPQIDATVDIENSIGSACPVEKGSETVLVVEDDPAVRKLVVRVLGENGYHAIETGLPAEALSILENLPRPIDLLISDVVMPIISGPALAKKLQEKQPGLKVLFISGYTEQAALRHKLHGQKIHFLHKPFAPEELCQAVTKALIE